MKITLCNPGKHKRPLCLEHGEYTDVRAVVMNDDGTERASVFFGEVEGGRGYTMIVRSPVTKIRLHALDPGIPDSCDVAVD